jgi:Uncharacterised nucleotidyltransferase
MTAARGALLALLRTLPDHPAGVLDVAGESDWSSLVDQAAQDGILALLAPALRTAELPRSAAAALEQRLAVGAVWHRHVATTLEQVIPVFEAAGVKPVALKGPVLAERLYGDVLLRPCMDLDLLVAPGTLDTARRALEDAGYAGDTALQASYLLQHAHHLHFSRPGAPSIELHFRAYAGFGVVLAASALLDRAVPHVFLRRSTLLVPSPEDEFIYLAVHAAGHSFVRLVWLYDLKLLLRRHPTLDWDEVGRRAESLGVASAVGYATRLLEDWLDVAPAKIPRVLAHRGARAVMADRLLAEVSAPRARSIRDNVGGLVFTALLCDRVTSTAWLLQHHIGRAVRHRLQRLAPGYLPRDWAA